MERKIQIITSEFKIKNILLTQTLRQAQRDIVKKQNMIEVSD
jgi:hypothetical protein